MSDDPIVDEVRAIRDAIADENNYDLDAIFLAGPGHGAPGVPAGCQDRRSRALRRSGGRRGSC